MGFIERLRKNFEDQRAAAEQTKKATLDALRIKQEQDRRDRQDRELKSQRVSEERKKQALSFYRQSGIGGTLRELDELVATEFQKGERDCKIEIETVSDGDGGSWVIEKEIAGGYGGFGDISRYLKDRDSVMDYVFWIERRTEENPISKVLYDEFHEKIIIVETSPEGTIRFHAGRRGSAEVPYVRWKNEVNVLDLKLENAYKYPLSHSYRKRIVYAQAGDGNPPNFTVGNG